MEKPPNISRAKKYWNSVRAFVKKGIFSAFLTKDLAGHHDFLTEITRLWNLVQKYASTKMEVDTTTQFFKTSAESSVYSSNTIDGLSLDYIPNINPFKELKSIARSIVKHAHDTTDMFIAQIQFNRGWKLLLLGLTQEESFARYMSMYSLETALSVIKETLLDNSCRYTLVDILINLIVADEREENRLKAIHLIGQLALQLGSSHEHLHLINKAFKQVATQLLEIQYKEKSRLLQSPDQQTSLAESNLKEKIYLYHALGKFTKFRHEQSRLMDEVTVFLIHEEFAKLDAKMGEDGTPLHKGSIYLHQILLQILNELRKTEKNKIYIGASFRQFILPLIQATNHGVQMSAVQFLSNWLPVKHDEASIISADIILAGMKACHKLFNAPEYEDIFELEEQEIAYKLHSEELKAAFRAKLISQLLQMPGTFAKLDPAEDFPGFFVAEDCTMNNSVGLVCNLPINPKSMVFLTRPLRVIPGVPSNATTVPPIFVDPSWKEKQAPPKSSYEYFERTGELVGLPPGCTYSPNPLYDCPEQDIIPENTSEFPIDENMIENGISSNKTKNAKNISVKDDKKIPPGFLLYNPFPSNENEKKERTKKHQESAIYSQTVSDSYIPEGYTGDRNPVLWPNKNQNLKIDFASTDFPENAPVLFGIYQPGTHTYQRILATVKSINKELTAVAVKKEGTQIHIGTSFNLFVRSRTDSSTWTCVNLVVIDADYDDDMGVGLKVRHEKVSEGAGKTKINSFQVTNVSVPPAGNTPSGVPYFAPPINLYPIPIGYTEEDEAPYYAKTSLVKTIPLGMNKYGKRFFPKGTGSLSKGSESMQNTVAGYDNQGQPFFLPRGCSIPQPTGFTSDGIPYYTLAAMLQHRGVMLNPDTETKKKWKEIALAGVPEKRKINGIYVETHEFIRGIAERYIKSVGHDRIDRKVRLGKGVETPQATSLEEIMKVSFADPDDIVSYLRSSEDFAYLRPSPMKMNLEPETLEFQSVNSCVTKYIVLKYRAARGDHTERNFYVSVDPLGAFQVNTFHLKLQGEGVQELHVSFYPTSSVVEKLTGTLNIVDESGNKLAMCILTAVRQSFIKVNPSRIDCGWVLPGGKKEILLQIESTCTTYLTVNIYSSNEKQSRGQRLSTPKSPKNIVFNIPIKVLKLQPMECKSIPIIFEPLALGQYTEVLEVHSPGGSITKVEVQGISGTPIAVFPEDEECSEAGSAALTRERCDFMRKFKRAEMKAGEKNPRIPLSEKDTQILKTIMAANSGTSARKEAYSMDFGMALVDTTVTRCLTIMNLSSSPVTVGLYCYNQWFQSPYMVRIASYTANTVEIKLVVKEGMMEGPIDAILEILCPDFQNLSVSLKAFVGYPLFIPSWDFIFFKPLRIECADCISVPMINLSHYPIYCSSTLLGKNSGKNNYFSSSLPGIEDEKGMVIESFSNIPVLVYYHTKHRGPSLQEFRIRMMSPFKKEIASGHQGKKIYLVGMCVEPFIYTGAEEDKNDLNFLRMWMSHPKRLLDEYPTEDKLVELAEKYKDEVPVIGEPLIKLPKPPIIFQPSSGPRSAGVGQTTDVFVRRSQLKTVMIENSSETVVDTTFFASTCYSVDPRQKLVEPLTKESIDVMYIPPEAPDFVTTYGFAAAIDKKYNSIDSVATVGKHRIDFLVFPTPGPSGDIIIDFGNYTISTKDNSEKKFLLFCNTSSTNYSWSLKFVNSKTKFIPFDTPVALGELGPNESFPLPVTFYTDSSGTYECQAEIQVKETLDRISRYMKIATVICKGTAVLLSAVGFPESIDFGYTVVFHQKQKSFVAQNKGSTHAAITTLVRPPFQIFPKSCNIPPGGEQVFIVTYSPTESKNSTVKLLLYVGHKLQVVNLSGHGGIVEMVCEKYDKKEIFFGYQKEGTISWIDVYLTNKGTMSLMLKATTTMKPDLIRLEYVQIVSTIPYDNRMGKKEDRPAVSKNYWSTVRKKIRVITIMKGLLKKTVAPRIKERRALFRDNILDEVISMAVSSSGTDILAKEAVKQEIPTLRPFYSYYFRVGLINKHQTRKQTELNFHYLPVVTEEDSSEIPNLLKTMTLTLSGAVYRELEIFPNVYDFGNVPAESYLGAANTSPQQFDTYGVERDSNFSDKNASILFIKVVNPGFEAQNLTLQHITAPFSISGRAWHMTPGEKIEIPVEFHPPRGQEQHQGEAVLTHKHGSITLQLIGTGACAEVDCDKELDFGTVKLQVQRSKTLRISNRGLLSARYELQIFQKLTEYRFSQGEPFDKEGLIESGNSEQIELTCCCQSLKPADSYVLLRWQRVPRGIWEEINIPIAVLVGQPLFKLSVTELDFGVTYIDVNKKIFVDIRNDGNAACGWIAKNDDPFVTLDDYEGVVGPMSSFRLGVLFTPSEFKPLGSVILFETEAGKRNLSCYGTVGVPYLKIAQEDFEIDFGIAEIGRSHPYVMEVKNTGSKPIEFSIQLSGFFQDGIELESHEYGVFLVEPNQEVVQPHSTAKLTFTALPREYNSIVTGRYVVNTTDGERYVGSLKCVGGKAIIKVAPIEREALQEITKQEAREVENVTSDLVTAIEIVELNAAPAASDDTRVLLYHTHLQTLVDALNGIKTSLFDTSVEQGFTTQEELMLESSEVPIAQLPEEEVERGMQDLISEEGIPEVAFQPGKLQGLQLPKKEKEIEEVVEEKEVEEKPSVVKDFDNVEEFLEDIVKVTDPEKLENELIALERILDELSGKESIPSRQTSAKVTTPTKKPVSRVATAASKSILQRVSSDKSSPIARIQSPLVMSSRSLSKSRFGSPQSPPLAGEVGEPKKIPEKQWNDVIERVSDLTEEITQHLKQQIEKKGTRNRKYLSQALRKIAESMNMIEGTSKADTAVEGQKKKFSMGLLRGGQGQHNAFLFNIPNSGNLPFPFEVVKSKDKCVYPHGVKVDDVQPFVIPVPSGIVQPKESVNLMVNFVGAISGLYEQEYEVKSNDIPIFKFTVTANIGNPKLVINPGVIDFGLCPREQSIEKYFVLSNVGTYRSSCKLESISLNYKPLEAGDAEPDLSNTQIISLSNRIADIEPSKELSIKALFSPPCEGFFEQKFKITWEDDPLFLLLKGVGSIARLKLNFPSKEEELFQGLLWGTCVVGEIIEKWFTVYNHGNGETIVKIAKDLQIMNFELPATKTSILSIQPGELLRIKVILAPQSYQKIETNTIVVEYNGSNNSIVIPMRGLCGIMNYVVNGELEFFNMKVETSQSKVVEVANTGDLDIMVTITTTSTSEGFLKCFNGTSLIPWGNEFSIRSKDVVSLEFVLTPTKLGIHSGKVEFSSKVGSKQIAILREFQLRVYDEQLCIDNSNDVDVGKVTVGETVTIKRLLMNYGTSKVIFRAKIEYPEPEQTTEKKKPVHKASAPIRRGAKRGAKGKGAEKVIEPELKKVDDSWKIIASEEGEVEPGQEVFLECAYAPQLDTVEELNEAKLIVEKFLEKEAKWVHLMSIKLSGSKGIPKIVLKPEILDFNYVAIMGSITLPFQIVNEGTSGANYAIEEGWSNNDVFRISPNDVLSGRVNAGDSVEYSITFNPTTGEEFSTQIYIDILNITYSLELRGEGAQFNIYQSRLPTEIRLGTIYIGEYVEESLPIYNDCVYDIRVKGFMKLPETLKHFPEFVVTPEILELPKNPPVLDAEHERSLKHLRLKSSLPLPVTVDDNTDVVLLEELLENNKGEGTFCIEIEGVEKPIHIPVLWEIGIRDFIIYQHGNIDVDAILLPLTAADFGEVNITEDGTFKFIVHNPNTFPVPVQVYSDSENFITESFEGVYLSAKGYREVTITSPCIEFGETDKLPQTLSFSGSLLVQSGIFGTTSQEISMKILFIDRPGDVELIDRLDFGNVFKEETVTTPITFRNPVRRIQDYRFIVKDPGGAFRVSAGEEGKLLPRRQGEVEISFCPKSGFVYTVTATLETEENVYQMEIVGRGVEKSLRIDPNYLDFGVVGIQNPEKRIVTIINTCQLPFEVKCQPTSNLFQVKPNSLILDPGVQYSLEVCYFPENFDTMTGEILFMGNNEKEVVSKIKVKGKGGTLDYNVQGTEKANTLVFSNVPQNSSVRKIFYLTNTGDTTLEVGFYDDRGSVLPSETRVKSPNKCFSYQINPPVASIPPKSKKQFAVTILGVKGGQETTMVKMTTLSTITPKDYLLELDVSVIQSTITKATKKFVKIDPAIEVKINVCQDDMLFTSEEHLWKVLLPVVKVRPYRPSAELLVIPAVEPNVTNMDITSLCTRPAAIPSDGDTRRKNWYNARVALRLFEKKEPSSESALLEARKKEAGQFFNDVEEVVVKMGKRRY